MDTYRFWHRRNGAYEHSWALFWRDFDCFTPAPWYNIGDPRKVICSSLLFSTKLGMRNCKVAKVILFWFQNCKCDWHRPGTEKHLEVGKQINDNNWHHLAVSWDSTTCRLSLAVDNKTYDETDLPSFCGIIHHSDATLTVGHVSNTGFYRIQRLSRN